MGDPSPPVSARYGGSGSPAPLPRKPAMERTDQHRSGTTYVNPRSSMLRADAESCVRMRKVGAPFSLPPDTCESWDKKPGPLLAARQREHPPLGRTPRTDLPPARRPGSSSSMTCAKACPAPTSTTRPSTPLYRDVLTHYGVTALPCRGAGRRSDDDGQVRRRARAGHAAQGPALRDVRGGTDVPRPLETAGPRQHQGLAKLCQVGISNPWRAAAAAA